MDERIDLTDLIRRAEQGTARQQTACLPRRMPTFAQLARLRLMSAAAMRCSTPAPWSTSRTCALPRPGP